MTTQKAFTMIKMTSEVWPPSISVHYLTITKLYNFLKKTKLIVCDHCFTSDVKMVDTFLNKPSFTFILLFLNPTLDNFMHVLNFFPSKI